MPKSVFSYPGGKTNLAPWIVEHIPDHYCYVEPFCGSASVLINKPRSPNEVINDRDGDVVQFFEVLRDDGDALVEWLNNVPYSRDLYEEWSTEYYDGHRPSDGVERAGRFFYLRYSQFAGKYCGKGGFRSEPSINRAQTYNTARDELRDFAERFQGVLIENKDYADIVDQFDSSETVFYCDPPYVGTEEQYLEGGEFDHSRLFETLFEINGRFLLSYADLPSEWESGYWITERSSTAHMGKAHSDNNGNEVTERLLMNFDPEQTPLFDSANQSSLSSYGDV